MTSRPARERELFLAALEREGPDRQQFLRRECGNDVQLRRRIEALIAECESPGEFLEGPAIGRVPAPEAAGKPTVGDPDAGERAGSRIGRYKLLQRIGEGGCGIVYMAEQEEPVRRRVALKIIKLGMDTQGVIARFEAERQALAMMNHPNIARVFDAGATGSGRPYFVMELVSGIPITQYCDQCQLSTNERLQLFIQVCQAIQHAHQKGIIHRDIKPSNILVTLHDGVPVPKVIDFGIAKAIEQKLTEKTLFTLFQAFIGTPAYMSPEQAQMSGLDIDTRSDIYSLGVLMYSLLTGKTPFDPEQLVSQGIDACRKCILEVEPDRPSQMLSTMMAGELTTVAGHRRTEANRLIHQLRGDLDWIVMKCLEKDRTRRYASAADLAADVQRYQDSEPVHARPPSSWYRLSKFVRRHRVLVGAAATVTLTLILGASISLALAVRAIKAETRARQIAQNETQLRRQAEQEKATARLNAYVADVGLAQQSLKEGNLGRAVRLLQRQIPTDGESDLRGFEWRYLSESSKGDAHEDVFVQDEPVRAMAFSSDGKLVAVSDGQNISIIAPNARETIATLSPQEVVPHGGSFEALRFPAPTVDSIAFVANGRVLASATRAGVRLFTTDDWTELRVLDNAGSPLAASADGSLLAAQIADGYPNQTKAVMVWDTATWQPVRRFENARGPMAISSDRQWLAADSAEGIRLWSFQGYGEPLLLPDSSNLFGHVLGVLSDHPLAFTPDGTHLVAARNTVSRKGVFILSSWRIPSGEPAGEIPTSPEQTEHTGVISGIGFSPDGRILATASMDHSIRLWDFQRRTLLHTLYGHLTEIWSVALSPDGRLLASGDKAGNVRMWETERPDDVEPFPGMTLPLGFSRESSTLAGLDHDSAVVFVNLATRQPVRRIHVEGPPWPFAKLALSDNLKVLAQGHGDGKVTVWNTDSGESSELKISARPISLLALSPEGRYLIAAGRDEMPRWCDLRTGTNDLWDIDAYQVKFSPDGRRVAHFAGDGTVAIWHVESRNAVATLTSPDSGNQLFGFLASFSPDGNRIAIALANASVGMWNTQSGEFIGEFEGHKQLVSSVAFSPDGLTLATAGSDSTLRLWNVATRAELLIDRRLGEKLHTLVFSPDGQLLVGAGLLGSAGDGLRTYRAPRVNTVPHGTLEPNRGGPHVP